MLVPGSNLLALALGVLGAQRVEWRRFLGQETLATGAVRPSWAAPVPVVGSVQPLDGRFVQQLGLDWTKAHVQFRATGAFQDVDRDKTGDRFTYAGRHYQVLSKTDWHAQDGWQSLLCVEVRNWAPPPAPLVISPDYAPSTLVAYAPAVTIRNVVQPAYTPSAEVPRAPAVTPGPVTLAPAFAPSEIVARAPAVTLAGGTQTVAPAARPSEEVARPPTVTPGAVTVAPAARPSEEVARAPTVTVVAPGLNVSPAYAPSEEVARAPTVTPGPVTVAPAASPSQEVARAPAVMPGPVTVAPAARPSEEVARAPTVTTGGGVVVFVDDFTRPDEDLGASPNWTRTGGTPGAMSIVSNQLRATNTGGLDTPYMAPDAGNADTFCELTNLVTGSLNGVPLCQSVIDANNFFGFRPRTTNWQAIYKLNGSYTALTSSASGTNASGSVYKAARVGNDVTLYRDGVAILGPITLPAAFQTQKRVGIGARADSALVASRWRSGPGAG